LGPFDLVCLWVLMSLTLRRQTWRNVVCIDRASLDKILVIHVLFKDAKLTIGIQFSVRDGCVMKPLLKTCVRRLRNRKAVHEGILSLGEYCRNVVFELENVTGFNVFDIFAITPDVIGVFPNQTEFIRRFCVCVAERTLAEKPTVVALPDWLPHFSPRKRHNLLVGR
jgi:hypothetical protein